MTGDLVAQPVDETKWYSGISQLEDAKEVKVAVESGDWLEAGIGAVTLGADVAACLTDPTAALGMVIEAAVGWLMEHLEPLKEALDKLAGNPEVVKSFGQTWKNVSDRLNAVAEDYTANVTNDLAEWTGAAADAYRAAAADRTDALRTTAETCAGVSSAVTMAGEVVAAVRIMIRDLIAALVSGLIEAVLPPGPGTARAAVKLIRNVLQKVVKLIGKLIRSLSKLAKKLPELIRLLTKVAKRLKPQRGPKGGPPTTKPRVDPNAPKTDKPNDSTSTSSADTTTTSSAPDTRPPPDVKNSPDTTSPSSSTTPSSTTSPDTSRPNTKNDTTTPSSTNKDTTSPSARNQAGDDPKGSARPESERPTCGDPVDIVTGEVLLPQTDVTLDGTLPLRLTRSHLSRHRIGARHGTSWASTLDQRLEVDELGICFVTEDGMVLLYPNPQGSQEVLPLEGPRWPLVHNHDGTYTVTDVAARRIRHFAHGTGKIRPLTAITDFNGNRIDIDHDVSGVPTAIRHSGGYHLAVHSTDGLVTAVVLTGLEDITLVKYGYDDRRLAEVVNSSGAALRFTYDDAGRIVQWQDRNGMWYRYEYDDQGRCVRNVGAEGFLSGTFTYLDHLTVYTDSLGNRREFHLNDSLQIVREVDANGAVVATEWDRYDRPLSRTNPLGHTTRFSYDEAGNLIAVTDPDGLTTTAEYNDFRQPTVLTRRDGSVWRNEYDERGNLSAVTDPADGVNRYRVNERGHLIAHTNALGQTRHMENNAAGLPIATTDFLGAETHYARDAFGRVSAVVDTLDGITRLNWTVEGRLIRCVQPDGTTEQWRYDGEGNEIAFIDALGQEIRTEYTGFDLPTAKIDVDGSRLEFRYDTELRLVSVTDPRGMVWRYTYDPAGNLVAETDFTGRTLTYENDAAGQLVARTNGAGEVTRYRRDLRGNVVEKRVGDVVTTYEFDAVDQMVRAVGPDAELVFHRDPLGRVTEETCDGRAVESTYDLLGRRTLRITPAGVETAWEYDANDQPLGVHVAGHSIRVNYDAAGREVRRRLGSGATVSQTWDANHRLTGQQVTDSLARTQQRRTYRYRADGAATGLQDQLTGARAFDLDRSGRVTAVRGPGWTERYAYDESGNITSAAWPGRQTDDQGAREYSGALLRRSGNVFYRHDAQGRVVERTRRTLSGQRQTWRYTWDAEDRMVGVTTPDGTAWRYLHDPLGRRIAKQRLSGGQVVEETRFTWDGVHLAEQSHRGAQRPDVLTTTWDRDGVRPVSQVERRSMADAPQKVVDERFFAIVTDLLGTPTELLDESGGVAWHAQRTLWGITNRGARTATDTPLRFPGQYFDPETGLHHNYFRTYDPANGQYLSADPLGLGAGLNQRAYALNPMGWLDYLGLLTCKQNAAKLRENMRAEGRGPAPGEAAAHIVPSGGTKNQWASGAKSRDLLEKYDVDINDAANGIPLGHPTPHNYTHRGGFHDKVFDHLQKVVTQGEARGLDKAAIGDILKTELRGIGKAVERELKSGQPGPGAYWTA
ncbi:RHS repeat protein [Lentzea sp. PSKA42]|uniref:RHS repeat protein n=1 Tax=Lentzea indica TaxID=2604800 RepID=A0ABX1FMP3_9PSEU|nr:RHS repeat-associated core domain-containing protein [Lentzea indica]NKE59818.1 RHS repeat protein [Lentzea indica]